MDEDRIKVCKYCRKELHEFDCNSLRSKNDMPKNKFLKWLFKIFMILEAPLSFLQLSVTEASRDDKLKKAGKIVTCTNKDCIGYLEGCMGKGKGLFV